MDTQTQIWMALIQATVTIAGILASCFAAWVAYLAKSQATKANDTAKVNSALLDIVHRETNSMKDQLVAAVKVASRAEGVTAGRAEHKAEEAGGGHGEHSGEPAADQEAASANPAPGPGPTLAPTQEHEALAVADIKHALSIVPELTAIKVVKKLKDLD